MDTRRKNYTNGFRLTITLKEPVCAETLQRALERIAPRFPTVIAGIRCGVFQYRVVPIEMAPRIRMDRECLAPMRKDEIKNCAFRVLYHENSIAAEFFHSLTDGYGGLVVLTTLVAEYLHQKHGFSVPTADMILDADDLPAENEITDDYLTFSGRKAATLNHCGVYQLPGSIRQNHSVLTSTEMFAADEILRAAHYYGVSANTFLCGVMMASIMEIQNRCQTEKKYIKPVQVMVPVNLRRLFPSQTLRNFSLFALSRTEPQDSGKTFEELLHDINKQLTSQITSDNMAAIMATHTKAARFPLYRIMPLPLKWLILRLAHQIYGEGNSCISLSNLGVVSLPKVMQEHIEGIDFILTPRIKSPYNCGVVSFDGILSISFSRLCLDPELENVFLKKLKHEVQIASPSNKRKEA